MKKVTVVVWFWKFLKISPTSPKYHTHKNIVVHFFISMFLLPQTPTLIYLKLKKIKGPKTHSLHFTSLHFHHKHGKKRSIAGTAQHSTKYSTCKTSAGVNKKFLHFYKRNPFKFFLKSPSIFKRNPIKKNRLQFYMENPL